MKNPKNETKKAIVKMAFAFSEMSANSKCVCIYHQPKKPEELNSLKRFKNK